MTKKILLIDDDADDQLFFTDVLGSIDPELELKIAVNGLEGMDVLTNGYMPDIIFLDLNMPYMNGFDFLRTFRTMQTWNEIPVVIFTTSNHERDIELSEELGAQAFLTKPNSVQELHRNLEQLIMSDFMENSQQMRIF